MENTTIRNGVESDIPDVLILIKELAEFEKAAHKVNITESILLEGGFGESPIFEILIAENRGKTIGMALYYPRFSTWNGSTIYLEDLIVQEQFRGQGVGKKLMTELISICNKRKAVMLHWEVLDWNSPAIEFYKKNYQTEFDDEWVNVKIPFNQNR